ncbi:hypothetical protein [Fodinicola feengrottensis]|uniref:Uncharacterized protein n=1 Tax=Fodinicola feengrottensis TaxID=435914 RepID=A0ABN2GUX5_9ACTN|nr:hypothetical protein [Fodinicola feengrottensis]
MPKIVVPVGYPMGISHPADDAGEPAYYEVLVGQDQATLTESGQRLWSLAFSDHDAHREQRFTLQHLENLAQANGISDPDVMGSLLKSGLLVEFEVGERSSIDFLKHHNLHPNGMGVGNTPDDPSMFKIAVGGQVVLTLHHDLYVLWSGSIRFPSMWDQVRNYQKYRTGAPLSGEQLGYLFAATVPVILAAGAGYLDRT